jgi:REP element-mobilizing transposase RayT
LRAKRPPKDRWDGLPSMPSPGAETVDLDAFRPVDPWKSPELSETKRALPHLQTPEATYFVTFRCRQGLLLSELAREIVMSAIRHWDAVGMDLDAAVVMPDHVHLIFRVLKWDRRSGLVFKRSSSEHQGLFRTVDQCATGEDRPAVARRKFRSHRSQRAGVGRKD